MTSATGMAESSRRRAKASAPSDGRSSHCTSSIATSTGDSWAIPRKTESSPAATARDADPAARGAARRSAASTASRCGSGSAANASSSTEEQEVGERGESELGLCLSRATAKDAVAGLLAEAYRLLPDGRLADPRLARQKQRRVLLEAAVEEPLDRRELVLATDHRPHDAQSATIRPLPQARAEPPKL